MIVLEIAIALWLIFGLKKATARIVELEGRTELLERYIDFLINNKKTKDSVDEEIISDSEKIQEIAEKHSENPIQKPYSSPIPEMVLTSQNIQPWDRPEIIRNDIIPESENPYSVETYLKNKDYQNDQENNYSEPLLPDWIMRSLTGGRLFVTLGLGLLFIGVAMLFKYAAQYIVIPIEMRFIAVAIGALGMMVFGHKQIDTRRDYGLYLIGGGLGILFLTVFTAFKFYALLSPSFAFLLLAIIGFATFASSIKYNTMPLAVLAITGGFLAPILTSTGHGSHIGLFSYYLLLNFVIFAISWHKSWRVLNSIGFAFTFVIGLAWGGRYYVPEFYQSVQFFLVAYFLLYAGIGVLFASRERPNIAMAIDGASVFGVPLIGFSLQLALTKYYPNGQMLSCIAFGLFYGCLSVGLRNKGREGWKLLSDIYVWLSGLFLTLAIPFAFDAHTTAPMWAMEGAAMLWMHSRTRQNIYGYAGILLCFLSNIFLLTILDEQGIGIPFANGFFVSVVILALAHFISAYFLHQNRSHLPDTSQLATVASSVGMLWWFMVFGKEMEYCFGYQDALPAYLLSYSIFALAATLAYERFEIALFDKPIKFMLYAIVAFTAFQIVKLPSDYHPFMGVGLIAYVVSFAVHYFYLWNNKNQELPRSHIYAYIVLVWLIAMEIGYYALMFGGSSGWQISAWLLVALVGIALLISPEKYRFWPVSVLIEKYQQLTASPLILVSVAICILTFTGTVNLFGQYIPILNITDIDEIVTIYVLSLFYYRSTIDDRSKNTLIKIIGILSFLFINAFILRLTSSVLGFEYNSNEMFRSVIVQTSITILWTLLSMGAMLVASRRNYRDIWFVGAALLGAVVFKLFFIDLASVGTLSRIISFMGVGLLTIALGYFSPIPPKKQL